MSAQKGITVDKTVLVVEDNPLNLKLTRDLLQLLECRVVEVRKAEEGLRIVEEGGVDLILMDIQLSGMDGLTAVRYIREDLGITDLPIVGVSALAMEGDREKALDAGCSEYITKPVDTRMFMGVVTRCLSSDKNGPARDRREEGSKLERRRVLIVDDNPTNVKLLRAMLSEEKYEIHEALNGSTALKMAASILPDVIFLDIMMPDMDGYEVTKRLRRNGETQHIPIVLVTALEDSKNRIRGLEAGAEDVLAKPVNRLEVVARTRSMVRLGDYRKQLALRQAAAGSVHQPGNFMEDGGENTAARVLVVEDNVRDMDLLKASLVEEPYEMLYAGNGKDALAILKENDVDLIILDILLPDMNGFRVLESAKMMPGRSTVQTVVTTCLDDLENKVRGVELGADDYLVKPINSRELKVRLKALLNKKTYMDQLKDGYPGDAGSAIRDSETGAYSSEFFMNFMDLEMKRSIRHKYSTSLVKVVVDLPDTLESPEKKAAAERLLRDIYLILKHALREIDLVARDEDTGFVVLLPHCGKEGALNVVKRMREALTHKDSPIRDELLQGDVSVCFGTATCPRETRTAVKLVALVNKGVENDRVYGETSSFMPHKSGTVVREKL